MDDDELDQQFHEAADAIRKLCLKLNRNGFEASAIAAGLSANLAAMWKENFPVDAERKSVAEQSCGRLMMWTMGPTIGGAGSKLQ